MRKTQDEIWQEFNQLRRKEATPIEFWKFAYQASQFQSLWKTLFPKWNVNLTLWQFLLHHENKKYIQVWEKEHQSPDPTQLNGWSILLEFPEPVRRSALLSLENCLNQDLSSFIKAFKENPVELPIRLIQTIAANTIEDEESLEAFQLILLDHVRIRKYVVRALKLMKNQEAIWLKLQKSSNPVIRKLATEEVFNVHFRS